MWHALHSSAKAHGTTVSDLVRQAVHEKYFVDSEVRMKAMRDLIGIRKKRRDIPDSTEYIRALRKGKRLKSLERP